MLSTQEFVVVGFAVVCAASVAAGSQLVETLSDLLDFTGTWQLVGSLLRSRLLLQCPFLSSALPHSSLAANDAGPLAGGSVALQLRCGCCAWSRADRNVLMYAQCGLAALMKHCTKQPDGPVRTARSL